MTKTPYSIRKNPTINTINIGGNKAVYIDDFLDDPAALVNYAQKSPFSPYPGKDEKKGYPGIRARVPDIYSYNITMLLEPLIKELFGAPAEKDIRKSVCAFSLITTKIEELGPQQLTPHFDSSTPNHIAVLLYLCDSKHGGTAFYRHNATGYEQITKNNVDNYLNTYHKELTNSPTKKNHYITESSENFTQIATIDAKFNRLVLYKGSLLHSAHVKSEESIDSNPQTGRLTVNTFYDF